MKRQKFGQHYLIDNCTIKRLIELAEIRADDRVLEIGAGRGALTLELSKLTKNLIAYELDRKNFLLLKELVPKNTNLCFGDAFENKPNFDVLVSSIPYYESSRFITWLSGLEYKKAVVVLQEQFVEKINSLPGHRNYRAISAIAQISSFIQPLDYVGPDSFKPRPRVNSRIVVLKFRRKLRHLQLDLIKKLFSLRRRKLITACKELGFDYSPIPNHYRERKVISLYPDQVYEVVNSLITKIN